MKLVYLRKKKEYVDLYPIELKIRRILNLKRCIMKRNYIGSKERKLLGSKEIGTHLTFIR